MDPLDALAHVPPHDLEAEDSVLGAIMLDQDAMHVVAPILQRAHFHRANRGAIYAAMQALVAQGIAPDVISVKAELKRAGEFDKLDARGGEAVLRELIEAVPSAAAADYYAKRVREKAEIRAVIEAARKIVKHAYEAAEEGAEAVLEHAERTMTEAVGRRAESSLRSMNEIMLAEYDRVQKGDRVPAVWSGFPHLDRITNGFKVGGLTIVAGRASMGKSSLALSFVREIAGTARTPTAFFTLEMSHDELGQNLVGQVAGISSFRLRANTLNGEERGKFEDGVRRVAEFPIFVDDAPGLTIMQLRSKARRLKSQYRIGLLVVDYLQLMEGERVKGSNREQEVAGISRGLKNLAAELKIAVIAVAQLNRAVEQRADKAPMLSDLRESGGIENDATLVLLLFREAYYKPDRTDLARKATVIVAKNRFGPTGRCDLEFQGEFMRFDP